MSGVGYDHYSNESSIKSIEFNQDYSCLCVGTKTGWSLINIQCDPIKESFSSNGDSMCLVGRLFTSSLVTLVSSADMRKLMVYHSKRNHVICTYRYTKAILAIKLNRKRLVVCLEDTIYIHNILDMELKHKIEETPINRNGIIALSPNEQNCYLAFPGLLSVGTVFLFDSLNLHNLASISAHEGPIAALEFNHNGSWLATASVKGTVLRVFSIPSGNRLMEFRRGIGYAQICSLSFSQNNVFLVATSNTNTIHVFKLDTKSKTDDPFQKPLRVRTLSGNSDIADDIHLNTDDSAYSRARTSTTNISKSFAWTDGLYGYVSNVIKASTEYLPPQVADVFQLDRSFVTARLPNNINQSQIGPNFRKIAAVQYIENMLQLIVVSMDGWLYSFEFDPVNGGDAIPVKQQCFLGSRTISDIPSVKNDLPPGVCVLQRVSTPSYASVVSINANDIETVIDKTLNSITFP